MLSPWDMHTIPRSVSSTVAFGAGAVVPALLAMLAAACYEPTRPPHHPPQLIVSDTGTADGASLLPVGALIDTGSTPTDKRVITLATTAGVFTTSGTATTTIAADVDGRALVLLRAPVESTTASVAAAVNGETVAHTIVFHRALPVDIDVVPDSLALHARSGAALGVTVYLRRPVGVPSAGLRIGLSSVAFDDSSAVGAFLPAVLLSDASGVLHARFIVADTTHRGSIHLRATFAESGISGDAVVQLLAP